MLVLVVEECQNESGREREVKRAECRLESRAQRLEGQTGDSRRKPETRGGEEEEEGGRGEVERERWEG